MLKTPHIIPSYSMEEYNEFIESIYRQNPYDDNQNIDTRLKIYSAAFLGMPYILGALGEGPTGVFDKSPLYRTDGFDCTTYVSTVLALTLSKNLSEFQNNIVKINYHNAQVSYIQRNHFMEVDWNINNQHLGYLQDINSHFIDAAGNKIAWTVNAIIDKPAWYRMKNATAIKTFEPITVASLSELITNLHELAEDVLVENIQTLYIPLTSLFDKNGYANDYLFNQIPSAAVIEIVRPNWDLTTSIGTHLHISHMGFALRDERGLIFRDASTITHNVRDILLVDYLQAYLDHPTIKGIHVQKILSATP